MVGGADYDARAAKLVPLSKLREKGVGQWETRPSGSDPEHDAPPKTMEEEEVEEE